MESKKNSIKKGIQLNQAFGAVLVLVLVATLVIIAILIFSSIGTSFAGTATSTVVSESVSPVTEGVALSGAINCSAGGFAISTAVNASGGLVSASNYTLNSATGVIANLTGSDLNPWAVNYSNTWGGAACDASDDMLTQFATYPALVGLVGTIIFLALVIGILVASFVFGGRRDI